jgi:hypothetical protein
MLVVRIAASYLDDGDAALLPIAIAGNLESLEGLDIGERTPLANRYRAT